MIGVTVAAISRLKAIRVDHPEDPVVRITVRDLDDHRLSFSITLESTIQPEDDAQDIDGVTFAIEGRSISRLDGVTLDYSASGGFRFLHDEEGRSLPLLTVPTLN
jgi:Fe-S cluster assembly iron-binding protein IscA